MESLKLTKELPVLELPDVELEPSESVLVQQQPPNGVVRKEKFDKAVSQWSAQEINQVHDTIKEIDHFNFQPNSKCEEVQEDVNKKEVTVFDHPIPPHIVSPQRRSWYINWYKNWIVQEETNNQNKKLIVDREKHPTFALIEEKLKKIFGDVLLLVETYCSEWEDSPLDIFTYFVCLAAFSDKRKVKKERIFDERLIRRGYHYEIYAHAVYGGSKKKGKGQKKIKTKSKKPITHFILT